MAFSKKTLRACAGMLCHENDAFKFSKIAKSTNSTCITCTIVQSLVELFFFSPNKSSVDQKHERKEAVELYYIFFKVWKFGYGNISLTLFIIATFLSSVAWYIGAQLMIFVCFRFQLVLFGSPGISNCHSIRCIC